jgi:membrane protein implicated in regulation of membrane protease activity
MFAFLIGVALIMLTVLGGITLLMGLIWLLVSWQFWAVMFAFCVLGTIINRLDRRAQRSVR